MRVLVIGGTRFIGRHTVLRLHEWGHEVTVFHRGKSSGDLPEAVRHLHCGESVSLGNREHFDEFRDRFRQIAPDVVLDMIPFIESDGRILMETVRGIAGRVVAISSVDVYRAYNKLRGAEPGPPDPTPLTEDSPLREKLYPYRSETPLADDDPRRWTDDYDKIPIERAVMSDPDLPGTVVRLPAVYGPHDGQRRLYSTLKRMDDGRPVILLDSQWAEWKWSRGYVENMADAVSRAVTDDRAAGRIYHVAEPESFTEREWIERIGQVVGWKGEIVTVPKEAVSDIPADRLPEALKNEGDPSHHLVVDSSRIRNELEYDEIVPLDEAIRRTIEWDRENPPAQVPPDAFNYDAEDAVLNEIGWKPGAK